MRSTRRERKRENEDLGDRGMKGKSESDRRARVRGTRISEANEVTECSRECSVLLGVWEILRPKSD